MTMAFDVDDAVSLDDLAVGEAVEIEIEVRGAGYAVTRLDRATADSEGNSAREAAP
jgi:Cu/Ag efflux protein CusF